MNRTLLDECFRVQGRTKWYEGPDQIQRDLDVFMASTTSNGLYDLIASQWLLPPISDPAQEVPLAI